MHNNPTVTPSSTPRYGCRSVLYTTRGLYKVQSVCIIVMACSPVIGQAGLLAFSDGFLPMKIKRAEKERQHVAFMLTGAGPYLLVNCYWPDLSSYRLLIFFCEDGMLPFIIRCMYYYSALTLFLIPEGASPRRRCRVVLPISLNSTEPADHRGASLIILLKIKL